MHSQPTAQRARRSSVDQKLIPLPIYGELMMPGMPTGYAGTD